jgi:hypothetical protein
MLRIVRPEFLDELPPDDPRAVHSRGDLRRVNTLMGNAKIMAGALAGATGATGLPAVAFGEVGAKAGAARTIVELGGGDGTFLLEVAKRAAPSIGPARVMLVDQQALVTSATRDAMTALSWPLETVQTDVFAWLLRDGLEPADVIIANLFLHHFEGERLATLLREAARQTRVFVACEPHRSAPALAAASLLGAIGCNGVTLHDARISVRAGFRGAELSAIWPAGNGWTLQEYKAGRFTHGFVARQGDTSG